MPDLKIAIFWRKIGENSKFRYKSSEYQNFTWFFSVHKRKVVIATCFVTVTFMVCRYFFFSKWRIKMSKTEKGCIHPVTLWFWRLTLPWVRWYPHFFFMKMTAKDVKEITFMPLVTFFSVLKRPGKTIRLVAITSPWLDGS